MKDLFISFRTANQTYSVLRRSVFSLMHRAEAALFSILILCKLATNLLFVSLMQQVWSLTLRFAPMHYLSNSNASDIFTSPAIIGCIVLIAVLTAFWSLFECSVLLHGLDLARKGESIHLPALLCLPAGRLSCLSTAELAHSGLQRHADPFHQFFPCRELYHSACSAGIYHGRHSCQQPVSPALSGPLRRTSGSPDQLGPGAAAVPSGAQKPVAIGS